MPPGGLIELRQALFRAAGFYDNIFLTTRNSSPKRIVIESQILLRFVSSSCGQRFPSDIFYENNCPFLKQLNTKTPILSTYRYDVARLFYIGAEYSRIALWRLACVQAQLIP